LTIVDAEAGTGGMLRSLFARPERSFITVLKGGPLQSAAIEPVGVSQAFEGRGTLQELQVCLPGRKGGDSASAAEESLHLRGVRFCRGKGDLMQGTVFVTNATPEALTTEEVCQAYLSRWPMQEHLFRKGRNGLGTNRSHGYCGSETSHVALVTRKEALERTVSVRRKKLEDAEAALAEAKEYDSPEPKDSPGARVIARARKSLGEAVRRAQRSLAEAESKLVDARSLPETIYSRDPTRENLATCAKMNAYLLLEYALRTYFGGKRMEPRTFIERYVSLPVKIRTRREEVVYEFQATERDPARMEDLRGACTVMNSQGLQQGHRRLRFEVVKPE